MEDNRSSKTYVAGVVMLYWAVSISLVYVNKSLVTNDAVPLFVTWFQCLTTCVVCWLCGLLGDRAKRNKDSTSLEKSCFAAFPRAQYHLPTAAKLMPLSLVFVCMIVFNQLTLQYVAVSFYNVARSLTIVFNALLSYLLLRSTISIPTILCLMVVIGGFFVGSAGEVEFSAVGSMFGILSSVFVSLNSIFTKKVLPVVANNAWRLAFINNFNACLLFLPLIYHYEGETLMRNWGEISTTTFWVSMVAAGLLGFSIGIVTVMQIQVTSPLTHNISGNAKAGAQSLLAFYIWGNEATPMVLLGIFLVLFGSGLYTSVKIRENDRAAAEKASTLPK